MKFTSEFASCGLNPVPHCIDCQHQNGALFVAFGSSHSVVVTRIPDGAPEGCGGSVVMVASIDQKDTVSRNMVPETDAVVGNYRDMESYIPTPRVNTVKFVGDGVHLLAGTSDGRVLLYKGYDSTAAATEEEEEAKEEANGPVLVKSLGPYLTKSADLFYSPSILCVAAAFYDNKSSSNNSDIQSAKNEESKEEQLKKQRLIIVAATACGLALIWDGLEAFLTAEPQVYKPGGCLLEACAIGVLSGEPLIALGCTDNKARILRKASPEFSEGAVLSGHLDWVRALAFSTPEEASEDPERQGASILLATGSQDTNIRVWRVSLSNNNNKSVNASLDSVLNGHDDWVTGVAWCGPKRLLSVSMDRTLSLWLPDPAAGVWISSVRLWGVPGSLLGGSVFGFHSLALADPSGSAVFAHGYTGAIHRWDFAPPLADPTLSAARPPAATQRATVPAGHTSFVTSVSWAHAKGSCPPYLASAGEDKTVRIYAPQRINTSSESANVQQQQQQQQQQKQRWYELARPLIHGHPIRRMCMVGSRHTFAVASEEKAIRLFDAPSTFIRSLYAIAGQEMTQEQTADAAARPLGAVLPPLSLSNRPVYASGANPCGDDNDNNNNSSESNSSAPNSKQNKPGKEKEENDDDEEEEYEVNEEEGNEGDLAAAAAADCPSTPTVLTSPPFEDHLTHNTMWPESRKLFAHVSEATCVAASRTEPPRVVSGCSAFRPGEATVCVWSPEAHVPIAVLQRHRGPVADVCVAPDGCTALSISLDMSIMLWGCCKDSRQQWEHLFTQERAFTKPPVACRWSPVCNIVAVAGPAATGVHLYRVGDVGDGKMCCSKCAVIQTATRSTAVAWCTAPGDPDFPLVLAVGQDSGAVEFWKVASPTLETCVAVERLAALPPEMAHVSSVNSLDWSDLIPVPGGADGPCKWSALLASGGSDNFVRITRVSN